METNNASAKASLDASIQQFRLDQRAWVGAKMATGGVAFKTDAPNLSIGQKVKMGIVLINSGKTPALKLRGMSDIIILPKNEVFVPRYRPSKEAVRYGNATLTPGGTIAMMIRPSEEVMTTEHIDDLKSARSILYLFGSYTYIDTFGLKHFTKVCMFADPDLTNMGACDTYNEAH